MTTNKSGNWLITVCGLNCAACDIHQAGIGNEKLRDVIVENLKKMRDNAHTKSRVDESL